MRLNKFCALLLFLASSVFSSDLPEEGIDLYEKGDYREAAERFEAWLSRNVNHTEFPRILDLYLDTLEDISAALTLLDELQEKTESAENAKLINLKRAFLLEMTGRVMEAQQAFEFANMRSTRRGDVGNFFHSIRLLISMGEFERAEAQTLAILTTAEDEILKNRAGLILSYIRFLNGKKDESASLLREVFPAYERFELSDLYLLYKFAVLYDEKDIEKIAADRIESKFGISLEAYELERRSSVFPEPSLHYFEALNAGEENTITADEEEKVRIQTGIFSKRSNAESLEEALRKEGFTAEIVRVEGESDSFFRVLSPEMPMKASQDYIIRLKEKGYEGFLLFP